MLKKKSNEVTQMLYIWRGGRIDSHSYSQPTFNSRNSKALVIYNPIFCFENTGQRHPQKNYSFPDVKE